MVDCLVGWLVNVLTQLAKSTIAQQLHTSASTRPHDEDLRQVDGFGLDQEAGANGEATNHEGLSMVNHRGEQGLMMVNHRGDKVNHSGEQGLMMVNSWLILG